jgi:hypothetical protein
VFFNLITVLPEIQRRVALTVDSSFHEIEVCFFFFLQKTYLHKSTNEISSNLNSYPQNWNMESSWCITQPTHFEIQNCIDLQKKKYSITIGRKKRFISTCLAFNWPWHSIEISDFSGPVNRDLIVLFSASKVFRTLALWLGSFCISKEA